MLDQIKRLVLFRIKSLEFQYKTWKKKREITQAYEGEKPPVVKRIPPAIDIRRVASVVAIILLLCLTGYGLYAVGSYVKDVRIAVPSIEKLLEKSAGDKEEKNLGSEKAQHRNQQAKRQAAMPEEKPPEKTTPVKRADDTDVYFDTIPELVMVSDEKTVSPPENTFEFHDSMRYVILANKADKMMYVLQNKDAGWETLYSFRMAIGANTGAKEKDGDQKTPEGLYFIVGRKEGRDLNEIYGPLAYVLNYPNAEDRRRGRTGQGIWIHGTAPDSMPVQTRGCLELDNANIGQLSLLLRIGIGTPVFIVNQKDLTEPAEFPSYTKIAKRRQKILEQYHRNQDYFARVVIDWQNAWESQQISSYEKFYDHQRFFGQGLAWEGWRERKIRTFVAYDNIRVDCKDILLTDFSESTAVVKFIQRYESDLLQVEGGKKLSLVKSREGWKIIGESTFPKEELLL